MDIQLKKEQQALFNKGVAGVLQQGCRSVINGTCVYRGPDGVKCVVGHLMNDDEVVEEKSVDILNSEGLLPERMKPHAEFLSALQKAHDRSRTFKSTVRYFRHVAYKYELSDRVIREWEASQA